MKKPYDSTVARIAGNILSGEAFLEYLNRTDGMRTTMRYQAVQLARAIIAEVQRTEPEQEQP